MKRRPHVTSRPRRRLRPWAFVALASLPLLILFFPVIATGHHVAGFDWDYFFTYYEAMRRTIVHFHQFPWWNPWVAGGVPWFGDPQVGLVSLQTPLVLLFGTVWGLKLAALVYFVVGFWGMYLLLRELKTEFWVRLLLSYVWVGSTFVTFHFFAGHYTFLLYLLSPWLFWLALRARQGLRWAIGLGAVFGFFISSAPHYMAVQALVILAGWLVVEWLLADDKKSLARRLLAALGLGLILAAPKLYFSYQYISQFASDSGNQAVSSWRVVIHALAGSGQRPTMPGFGHLEWWEYSSYLGLGAVLAYVIALAWLVAEAVRRRRWSLGLSFALVAVFLIIIGWGPFAHWSPYYLLTRLPVLKNMQVPSRWWGWSLFFMVLAISQLRRWRPLVIGLLTLAIIELAVTQPLYQIFRYRHPSILPSAQPFEQWDSWPAGVPGSSNMYQALISNYGEIRAYEPIIGRDAFRPTARCGINYGCQLVRGPARLLSWSPNRIVLARTGLGPIELNANPSSYWLVNGRRQFVHAKVTEPDQKFVITDPAAQIIVQINPL